MTDEIVVSELLARIEENTDLMNKATKRIYALEAALRQIVALDQKIVPPEDRLGIARSLARVALAPEQDK
jgi:hypothetical protein